MSRSRSSIEIRHDLAHPAPAARKMGSPPGCPVGEVLRFLGRPHVLDLLYYFTARPGPHRFVELQRGLAISPNTLSARLQDLVRAGFLTRTSYNEIPPRVDYEGTPKAGELLSIFESVQAWASKYDLRRRTASLASSAKPLLAVARPPVP